MEPAQEAEEDDEGVNAVNVMQKKRMDEAKIARAYMVGGMAPQQAAWKCGFKRVDEKSISGSLPGGYAYVGADACNLRV